MKEKWSEEILLRPMDTPSSWLGLGIAHIVDHIISLTCEQRYWRSDYFLASECLSEIKTAWHSEDCVAHIAGCPAANTKKEEVI